MEYATTLLGGLAAVLTSLASLPQVIKCWRTRSAEDLSLKMLLALCAGFVCWLGYGALRGDWVIILANGVSLLLTGTLLAFKLGERRRSGRITTSAATRQPV
jgi:MtN3 and saliva related transmembrane protein